MPFISISQVLHSPALSSCIHMQPACHTYTKCCLHFRGSLLSAKLNSVRIMEVVFFSLKVHKKIVSLHFIPVDKYYIHKKKKFKTFPSVD